MHLIVKSRAVNIIGSLSIAAGFIMLIALGSNLEIQFVFPSNLYLKFGVAIFLILSGTFLLLVRFQIKNRDVVKLKPASDEKSAEFLELLEKLKNCNGNYKSLIEQSFDAVYIVDFDGSFVDVNSSMCKMSGYTREELLKLNIQNLIDPEQLRTDPFTPHLYNYDRAVFRERRLVNKNGDKFDVEINIRKLDKDRLIIIANDITLRKQLETELHDAHLKFQTLAEKSVVGIYVIQKEKFVYINQRFAEVFGFPPYELINVTSSFIDVIISEDYRATVRKNLRMRYMGEVDYINYEVTGRKKDGTFNRVEFSGGRAIIEGEPTIVGTMIDITERWKVEDALKQHEANLQTIMDTTEIAYVLFNKELNVTAFNEMAAKFAVIQYNHLLKIGDHLIDYFPTDKLPQYRNIVGGVMEGGSASYEINYPQADGSVNWYSVRIFPIMRDANEIFGLIIAISNITERKITEDNLYTAYQRIQAHINSIKEMAWKQSHLIRSPLANLKGLVALLRDDPSDKEVLNNISTELNRLDEIIIEMAADASSQDDL